MNMALTLADRQKRAMAKDRWCKVHGRLQPCPVCVLIEEHEEEIAVLREEIAEMRVTMQGAYSRGLREGLARAPGGKEK